MENGRLRAELEVYKNRNIGGRKKHNDAWMVSYNDFVLKLESGMTIMEIVQMGDISRRMSILPFHLIHTKRKKKLI